MSDSDSFDVSRRRFLQLGLAGLACSAACCMARPAFAVMPRPKGEKSLFFHNLHTDERLRVTYWKDGTYSRPAFEKINHILRDHRTGDTYPMRAGLMDMIHDLQTRLKHHDAVEIISGYRSPKTNAMLANASDGVARQSLHTKGMAIDLNLNGMSLRQVQNAALFMQRGGVGYYPKSGFVHMDVGRVRRW